MVLRLARWGARRMSLSGFSAMGATDACRVRRGPFVDSARIRAQNAPGGEAGGRVGAHESE